MPTTAPSWIAVGAIVGAVGVALGAFGAHLLPGYLGRLGYEGEDLARRLDIFETAIRYQMYHALALVLTGLALRGHEVAAWQFAGWAFLLGVLIFSGLLVVLTFAGPAWNWLGMVVPIGGVSMIVGWIALAIGAWLKR